jgi:hypothetical protein
MRQLGISIYPDRGNLEDQINYIHLAGQYGFKRIFTCLISASEDLEKLLNDFNEISKAAKEYNMAIIADVSPEVFQALGVEYTDLKLFKDMGLSGIRLDLGFSGNEESIMTCNPYGLKIEINMSNGTRYLETILSYQPIKENLYGCHNFYPHRYTGLSKEHFLKCSQQFKSLNIRTAAFVSSKVAQYGPWPASDGLCTLEDHRDLDVVTQAKDLFSTGLIDDVIVANSFASEEELKALSQMNKEVLTLDVTLIEGLPEVERNIVLNCFHFNRGDVSDYMIRSTQSRVDYKGHHFEAMNTEQIKKGDILIDSSLYKRYAGELQIALKSMKNEGKTSVVGHIVAEELHLLDGIKPWEKFQFRLRK